MKVINTTVDSLELNPFIHSEVITEASIDPIFIHILIIFMLCIVVGIAGLILLNSKNKKEDAENE